MDGRAVRPGSLIAALVLSLWVGATEGSAQNPLREQSLIRQANMQLQGFQRDPKVAIPAGSLAEAQGIALFPEIIKAGFVVGGQHGQGLLLVRNADGTWSHPLFVNLTSGSIGLQAGVKSSDLVLLFRDRRSIERFLIGKGMLGLNTDAAVAAGNSGSATGVGTNIKLSADIVAFARNRGLFAGLSAGGTSIAMSRRRNLDYYGGLGADPAAVLQAKDLPFTQDLLDLTDRLMEMEGATVQTAPRTRTARPGEVIIEEDVHDFGDAEVEVEPAPAPTARRTRTPASEKPRSTEDPLPLPPDDDPVVQPPKRDPKPTPPADPAPTTPPAGDPVPQPLPPSDPSPLPEPPE